MLWLFWVITPEAPSFTLKKATMQLFETSEQASCSTLCDDLENLDLSYTCCESLKTCAQCFLLSIIQNTPSPVNVCHIER
jgi:hypothetical protein